MKIKNRLSRLIALAVCAEVFTAAFAHAGVETAAGTNSVIHESAAQRDARMEWWREARFGMFIHWGLYSIPAGVWQKETYYGEWFLEQTHMPVSQYEKYAAQFDPVKFDATAWVHAAKAAGVKYIVITSKHHDGFGMFRSDLTDWCIKRTPFQRDPLAELAAACKAEGIKFCLYYSIMDWHHPDWGNRRAWNDVADTNRPPDMDRYTAYMKGQLKELLTRYGPIGLLWFDGQWEDPWTSERGDDLYQYVRSLQPGIIVNNRVGKPASTAAVGFAQIGAVGDYGTPEQSIPPSGFGPGVDWESCMTMNDHWGYNKGDQNWKSAQTLVRNLIDCSSKGGNYLLNVGPTSEGLFPDASLERLTAIGDWMQVNGEAIYGTSASPFTRRLPWGRCTQKISGDGTKLYLHVFDWPADGRLLVPGLKSKVQKAYLLADRSQSKLAAKKTKEGVQVTLPTNAAEEISTTVVLEIKGAVSVEAAPQIVASASNIYQNQTSQYGPQFAFDGNPDTRWATDDVVSNAWIAVDLGSVKTIHGVRINEAYAGRVQNYELQYRYGTAWKTFLSGATLDANFEVTFPAVKAREFRLNILSARQGPTINEIEWF
ncbi:MAG TPA: alpha-L-fucosidase [Candidatus Acidoferrales bacterium]|jgi:alpha-L-fucosidase|nr:alpha-L-fucosidase [Candidatus Acidoferrales bacterium]